MRSANILSKFKMVESLVLYLFFIIGDGHAQILHTESFTVILDSGRFISGNIIPNLEFQTQKENLLEFENIADLSVRIKEGHAFTIANKIELSTFGEEVFLSGGYLYLEYRRILRKKITIEPYSQIHWTESRGLERKYAGGVNFRWRLLTKKRIGFFLGVGPFYEFERWNYDGVPDEVPVPPNPNPLEQENIKIGSYLSFKINPFENIFIDFSGYHQSRFDEIFSYPRLASSTNLTWNFSQYLGISLIYQNIYDFRPVVPIEKAFHKIIFGISLNF